MYKEIDRLLVIRLKQRIRDNHDRPSRWPLGEDLLKEVAEALDEGDPNSEAYQELSRAVYVASVSNVPHNEHRCLDLPERVNHYRSSAAPAPAC